MMLTSISSSSSSSSQEWIEYEAYDKLQGPLMIFEKIVRMVWPVPRRQGVSPALAFPQLDRALIWVARCVERAQRGFEYLSEGSEANTL